MVRRLFTTLLVAPVRGGSAGHDARPLADRRSDAGFNLSAPEFGDQQVRGESGV